VLPNKPQRIPKLVPDDPLALGRDAIGVDISPLADFVTTVKTTVFDELELNRLEAWAARVSEAVHMRKSAIYFADHGELGYYKIASAVAIADESTVVVQMIAFADPSWQLQRYLETIEEAGLSEVFLPTLHSEADGRLWRSVPNRRWYSGQRGDTPGSREVVLIHCKRTVVLPMRPLRRSRTEELHNRP